jgi:outer membrane protein OmpA-like peptidoglycan-associated protein
MTRMCRYGRAKPFLAPMLALGVAAAATPSAAQVVISSQGRGHVLVNPDVLDALGPPPTVPQLLDPNVSPSQAPRLRAPGTRTSQSETVPRSRIYALPPAPGTSNAPPPQAAAPRASAPAATAPRPTAAPAAVEPQVAQTPRPAEPQAPASTRPSPPERTPAAAPPPSPPERSAPRAPMTASAPPPPALDTPAPPRAPARPAAPAASAAAAPASPPPAAAPMASPASPTPQMAAAPGTLSRVLFQPGSADLNDDGRRELTQLAARLGREGESRVQLLAYADGAPETESQARRLSLSRALAVRSYLIEQGIRSTRVNVQALGIKSTGGPPDRVDAMAATP